MVFERSFPAIFLLGSHSPWPPTLFLRIQVCSIHQLFVLASHRPQPAQIHRDYFVLWGLTILRRHFGHSNFVSLNVKWHHETTPPAPVLVNSEMTQDIKGSTMTGWSHNPLWPPMRQVAAVDGKTLPWASAKSLGWRPSLVVWASQWILSGESHFDKVS